MSEQLTIKDLNCEKCPNREVNANDDSFCKVTGEELGGEFEFSCTARYGCASHPLALQVLAQPVIIELDLVLGGSGVGARFEGFTHGISKAISLLKGGAQMTPSDCTDNFLLADGARVCTIRPHDSLHVFCANLVKNKECPKGCKVE